MGVAYVEKKKGYGAVKKIMKFVLGFVAVVFSYSRCALGEFRLCVRLQNNRGRYFCFTGWNL